jgi:hypothetical protein
MLALFLRQLHLPPIIVFGVVFLGYISIVTFRIGEGFVREITGWRHPGQPSRLHRLLFNWHTGQHISLQRTYGDERRLRRAAGSSTRATPEGQTVYWHPWKRWHRALRNNLITFVWLMSMCGMATYPEPTVILITLTILLTIIGLIVLLVMKWRRSRERSRPVHRPALAVTRKAKAVFDADATTSGATPTLNEEKAPELSGVPQNVLATLLSSRMGTSSAEILNRLSVSPDRGKLILPDTFAALVRDRESVQEIIEAHTTGTVRFDWATTMTPRTLTWYPVVVHTLPHTVRFRDYLPQIEALGPRELAVGLTADRSLYTVSHNGDTPWHCRFAGSGTGKSMGFLVKVASICHKDPKALIYCIDTKQVSFEFLRGIPGVYIFDNPQSEMAEIWKVFHTLTGIMRDRYTAVREGRAKYEDFDDIWVFVDEGNDLGSNLKSYWKNILQEATANPTIWGECVGPLLRQGRQAHIFGEWMFQDLRDQAMGGESLKMAFSVFGAAGFLPGQFSRTIGNPVPECLEGPGRILMCRGNKRDWVQGFMDEPEWLREYALVNRRKEAAA